MITWAPEEAGALLLALARAAGLPVEAQAPARGDPRALVEMGEAIGLDVEPASYRYPELPALIGRGGPAILQVQGPDGGPALVGLLGGRRGRARLLGPRGDLVEVALSTLRPMLVGGAEGRLRERLGRLLDRTAPAGRERLLQRLVDQGMAHVYFEGVWLLRLPPSAPLGAHLRREGAGALLLQGLVGHALSYGLSYGALVLLGRAALDGALHPAWLLGWSLLLWTGVPAELLTGWSFARLTILIGGLIKRRLLWGALRIDPEEVRRVGIGGLLGLVIESESIEALGINGGVAAAAALVEVGLLLLTLPLGAPGLAAGLLVGALLALVLGHRYRAALGAWTAQRRLLTGAVVEQMLGHRSRVVQVAPADWHRGEEEGLLAYLERSATLDRAEALLRVGLPRAFALIGLLGLGATLGADPAGLAVGVGGLLVATGALARLTGSLGVVAAAVVAFEQVRPLWEAADRRPVAGAPGLAQALPAVAPGAPLIELRGLRFRHEGRGAAVLDGVNARIQAGDRILLEGPSGGGKSTLAALLVGLRRPERGLVLLQGLDPQTLGEAGYRRRAVCAPQFHENHVIIGSFAMNLLLGGDWPAPDDRIAAAEALCRELGLGPLIDRMPGGMGQVVGESGWRLSHGEKSRLFLARALLQGADLIVLDESFGALDPETMAQCLETVLRRAPTLLVIAHP